MPYLTDRELFERFEYYILQLEGRLLEGENLNTVIEEIPFGVHFNDSKTLEIKQVNDQLSKITGFHNDEVMEMGMEYLDNYLHPTTLANVSEFLPPAYSEMKSYETLPFIQYVKLYKDKDFSPLITFSKPSQYIPGSVVCMSLRPKDFGKMAPKMDQIIEMDRFKLKHFKLFQKLTLREVEVLTLLANGHNNPQIAHELSLSRQTIETHRKNLKRKLDLKSFRDLMKYAFAFNLVDC